MACSQSAAGRYGAQISAPVPLFDLDVDSGGRRAVANWRTVVHFGGSGQESGLVGEEVFTATLAASLLSIFLNVFIVRAVMKWADPKLPAGKMVTA